jgi:hypothetical protein
MARNDNSSGNLLSTAFIKTGSVITRVDDNLLRGFKISMSLFTFSYTRDSIAKRCDYAQIIRISSVLEETITNPKINPRPTDFELNLYKSHSDPPFSCISFCPSG